MNFKKNALVILVGPTGVGKTQLGLQLAEQLSGEIISADSRLFYRGMDIGTAKPTPAERARVRHHLIDVADPGEVLSLALFQRAAREAIEDCHERGKLPFLVGGTGQYIRAVLEEWNIPPQKPDLRLRLVLETWADQIGQDGLHARLAVLDPAAAQIIDPRNIRRTIRALEVIFGTGRPFSTQRQQSGSPYSLLTIGLTRPRQELYDRIDQRIEAMLVGGLVDEVNGLLTRGYRPEQSALSAIGYGEIADYLRGKSTLEEAVVFIKRYTRKFVRRQANWFKDSDPTIHWFRANDETLNQAKELVQQWVAGRIDE
ncbi:MAG TPA: tRNA (adenosine(37)-N6)-dimethylallyltransferase MiaA [Anaerolineaceae bacterium]|jgi:tRNA dimethylallyltransferase